MSTFAVLSVLTALIATTIAYGHGGYGGYGGQGGQEEDNGPAHYKFEYGVHDPHTGDIKQQHEVRDGHVVKGAYSFKEADGTTRVVEYEAGPHSGFNAVVKRIGHAHHPAHYGGHHGGQGGGGGAGGYGGGYGGGFGGAQSHVGTTHFGYNY